MGGNKVQSSHESTQTKMYIVPNGNG